MGIHVVLVEPEIPQNTGSIGRTCVAAGAELHLIEPLGFSIDNKSLKRAGLDYWHLLKVHRYPDRETFFATHPQGPFRYVTTKAPLGYTEAAYPEGTFLLFGKETAGLPEGLLKAHPERCVRIPMREEARSLNLSNAVAICVYEALRQQGFPELLDRGKLSR